MDNYRIVLLLITIILISAIIIPGVRAAGSLSVDFNATPRFGVRPVDVQFNDSTISTDPGNNTYLWAFGDGNTSIAKNPKHTYVTFGAFTVNLTVTEITGNNATLSKPFYIHVGDAVNTSDFSGTPQCGFSPLPVQFIDGSTLAHDQWEWTFGEGGTSNLSDPLHTYYGEGSRSVSLHIWNNSGGPQSIISKTDYIRLVTAGITSFSASITIVNGTLTIQFNDTSTGFVSPVSWLWDFGDNTTSTDQNPSHTYNNSSITYPVTLTVTGYCGQTMKSINSLSISGGAVTIVPISVPGAPIADFNGAPTSGSAPLSVIFTDLSTNNPTMWIWSFGDGNYSTIENPVHAYNSPGNYTVKLIAANPIGSSVKTRTEYISVSKYINVEIPTIELIIGNSSQDLSLILNETTSQTQIIPLAQSGDMVESGLRSHSLPMAQSVQPGLLGDQEQSFPQDTSPQNGLKAEPPPYNFNPASVLWPLNRSINNKLPGAFWMMVKSPVAWKVIVYNEEYDKPEPAGHMAEYNLSGSQYVTSPSSNVLSYPLRLQSERNNVLSPPVPLELTAYPGTELQNGSAFNSEGFKYDINLEQYVDYTDKNPTPGNQYRVVITFEAQTV